MQHSAGMYIPVGPRAGVPIKIFNVGAGVGVGVSVDISTCVDILVRT